MPRQSNKKEKLLNATQKLLLEKGFTDTTLANIATAADVPLGNVYYYFKTKAAIVLNVIEIEKKLLAEALEKIDLSYTTTELQLKAFIAQFLNINQAIDQTFGHMLTVFWHELSKADDALFNEFLPLFETVIDWCGKKFMELGKNNDQAKEYAIGLLSNLHGVCLMKKDPNAKKHLTLQAHFIETAVGIAG